MKKLLILSLAVATASAFAGTPSYGSFKGAELFGVDVSPVTGDVYTVSLTKGAYIIVTDPTSSLFIAGDPKQMIQELAGFYVLDAGKNSLNPVSASTSPNGWSFGTSNTTPGEVAGWNTIFDGSSSHGLFPAPNLNVDGLGSETFTFDSLGTSSSPNFGFDIRVFNADGTLGQTGHLTGLPNVNPSGVPAPAALASFGIGALGLLRRRIAKA